MSQFILKEEIDFLFSYGLWHMLSKMVMESLNFPGFINIDI
jgi:hypothetical protein